MAKFYKKKTTKKTTKRKTYGTKGKKKVLATTKVRRDVESEVRKYLASGLHNERRHICVRVETSPNVVLINTQDRMLSCIRVPITGLIPPMGGAPDVRRRGSNKVEVTGVSLRVGIRAADPTRVMWLIYEPHESLQAHVNTHVPVKVERELESDMVPKKGIVQSTIFTSMSSYWDIGLASKHGPLAVRKLSEGGVEFDSPDGGPYTSRVSSHAGRPIGKVEKETYAGGGGRTQNWNQGAAAEKVGAGWTPTKDYLFSRYWVLDKKYTYSDEESTMPAWDRSMELLVYVDCPSGMDGWNDQQPVVGANFKMLVDIYYHDM